MLLCITSISLGVMTKNALIHRWVRLRSIKNLVSITTEKTLIVLEDS